jgi:hypothetical protein
MAFVPPYSPLPKEKLEVMRQKRISSSSVGEFDMLTFISQRAINAQLNFLWKLEDNLREINFDSSMREGVSLHASTSAPQISLVTSGPNRQIVHYHVALEVRPAFYRRVTAAFLNGDIWPNYCIYTVRYFQLY